MTKLLLAAAAAALILTMVPAQAQAPTQKPYQCYRIDKEAAPTGDQWSLSIKQIEVEANDDGTGYDALRKCIEKLNDEKKRVNRRVMRA